jgi:two-component system, OmpR family, response regulator RegX3
MATDHKADRRRARVLVVDDDLACRILAALLLEKAGHSPTAVASVERALERFDRDGADLVLTDLQMPGESGLDLLLALRQRRSTTPVIVMTGAEDPELISRAFELGAKTVLRKPYSSGWLRAAVGAALEDLPAVA